MRYIALLFIIECRKHPICGLLRALNIIFEEYWPSRGVTTQNTKIKKSINELKNTRLTNGLKKKKIFYDEHC